MEKPKVYLASPVFRKIAEHPRVSESKKQAILKLWDELEKKTQLKVSSSRFPEAEGITSVISDWRAQIIGCHLSHRISKNMLNDSDVFAICSSTAGTNHIDRVPGILITHTPGVLHKTVADFTIAIILSNLRNTVCLHKRVWEGNWKQGQKWDIDDNLSTTIDNLVLGIVGMGEIGQELSRRLAPWGVKIIYYDPARKKNIEEEFHNIKYSHSLEEIFSNADIISLHVPLTPETHHLVGERYLRLMKKNALLVNTARGSVVDSQVLLDLLEKNEIFINLAFDVFDDEPLNLTDLKRFKKISRENPDLRFVLIPHNASADADTRAQLVIMTLEDILCLAFSNSPDDIKTIKLIPEQHSFFNLPKNHPDLEKYKIIQFWNK
jgi:glyoxylate reductase